MDTNTVMVWVELGGRLEQVGVAAFRDVRALFDGQDTKAADDAALAKLDALYSGRIAQAGKDAAGA